MVIEQDYVSQSENSEDAEDEDHEPYDADDIKEEQFFRKSCKMQKDGLISLLKIIKKS